MSLVLDEHRAYLTDAVRLSAFERAIAAAVRGGDVVIDLGSGTGILGLLAVRAGASKVYAIEQTSLGGLAREIAAANGAGDRIDVVRGHSTRVTLPELADVVVTDQIGHFGIEAGLFEYLPDARRRLLKPGGRTVPCGISWRMAPVECEPMREAVEFWRQPRAGFDFSAVAEPSGSSGYPTHLEPSALLAPAATVASAPLDVIAPAASVAGEARFRIERSGTLDGLGGWFIAELASGITITNGPDARERINRRQVVLPLATTRVEPGDTVCARIRFRPSTLMVDWQTVVMDREGRERVRTRRSTFQGMLIAPEDLAFTAPSARPSLTRHGSARQLALALCDGSRTVRDIESELRRAFPDILPTDEEAAAFVSEVLAGDAM